MYVNIDTIKQEIVKQKGRHKKNKCFLVVGPLKNYYAKKNSSKEKNGRRKYEPLSSRGRGGCDH